MSERVYPLKRARFHEFTQSLRGAYGLIPPNGTPVWTTPALGRCHRDRDCADLRSRPDLIIAAEVIGVAAAEWGVNAVVRLADGRRRGGRWMCATCCLPPALAIADQHESDAIARWLVTGDG